MVNVKIPTPLRKFTDQQAEVEIEGDTVKDIIDNLEKKYEGISKRLLDDTGKIRKFINIYVGEEDIRFLQKEETKVEGKEVSIVPAIAGGMATKILNLTFPKKLIKEPIIYNLGQKFKIITNIRKANVTADYGWVLLELDGDIEEIQKGEEYIKSFGIIVEDIEAQKN